MDVHSSNVGLMTGDACYNQEAAILIMTTEILHSILFKGSQLLREVKWVIFDEVHYMRDKERGVVWEETIVLLPESVKLIFLSATIPNSIEFANWIAKIKNSPCHVISTNFRPTPLRHYLFPSGGNHLILVQNELRKFQYNNVKHALESINETDNTAEPKKKRRFKEDSNQLTNQELDIKKLLNLCISSKYLPIIVFAFSKKEVENNAQIFCNLDLTTEQEKIAIEEVYNSALEIVSSEDRKLPQFSTHLAYLRTGIGVHHGGLLPIIKEITEILFQENLLKILFSTETFSMGINMPARSVIFTGLQKFDGERQRMITPGEYTQMSGRAGRRGIDTRGYSIVLLTSKYKEEQLERLFTGSALMLSSQFYLKYSTILNLLRIQGLSPMFIIKKSFFKFQLGSKRLQLEEDLKDLNKKIANLNVPAMYNTVFYNASNVNEDPDKIKLDERILLMLDTTNYDLAKYSIETYLEMGLSDYYAMVNANLNNFSSALMMPTFDWLSGKSFSYICSTYKLYEGTIVRSFKRIEEVLQEACSVAHLLGSTSLEELLIETLKLHRHGIIFTSSLYLVE
uniref:Uncharacterized helicase C17H9.02-like n=1 Tax=Dermatophagoides pteronyssinus TaxID=6956 RepID=A0A6P6YBY9_DERPT|nr:uncharacterized helicase C17H9.02-like [Dermatophagoides pteronyssinus]